MLITITWMALHQHVFFRIIYYIYCKVSERNYLFETEWRIFASVEKTIIGSDNGVSPIRCQAIIWTNDDIVNWNIRNTFQCNIIWNSNAWFQESAFENIVCGMAAIFSHPMY